MVFSETNSDKIRVHKSSTLEEKRFYKQCAHPSDRERLRLAIELGLEPRQIEFLFQNKRTENKNEKREQEYQKLRIRVCEMLAKQNSELRMQICHRLGHAKCEIRHELTCVERVEDDYSFLVQPVDNVIGMTNVMKLGNKVMNSYCSMFDWLRTANFHQSSELANGNVQIAVRKNTCSDHPIGTVIHATSSFWVPASPERAFSYLNDPLMRSQWDVLFKGGEVCQLMQIPIGDNPSNAISVLRPSGSTGLAIFQETMTGQMPASLLVYAPVDSANMVRLVHGAVGATLPILASGFTIMPYSSYGISPSTSSMITVAYQLLASSSTDSDVSTDTISNTVAFVNNLVNAVNTALA